MSTMITSLPSWACASLALLGCWPSLLSAQSGLTEAGKWVAPDAASDDRFGTSVDVDGDVAVVGAVRDDDGGTDLGAAYVLRRRGQFWHLEAELLPPVGWFQDGGFGECVAVDGDTVAVAAPFEGSGMVFVFRHDGNSWRREQLLVGDPMALRFGAALALDGDGMLVGAPLDHTTAVAGGAVYEYERSGSEWSLVARLESSDVTAHDQFGLTLAMDGATCVVGAHGHDDAGPGNGAAYVYERGDQGWLEQKLVVPEPAEMVHFGFGVALNRHWLAVGDVGPGSGHKRAVRMYERTVGGWTHRQVLVEPGAATVTTYFGFRMVLVGDMLVVGAPSDDLKVLEGGAGYLFGRNSVGTWSLAATLSASDAGEGAHLGSSVGFDGRCALLGAPEESSGAYRAGAAYLFDDLVLAR